jgi:hypothetical protein
MKAMRNFFRQLHALWCLPGLVAVLADNARSLETSNAADIRNNIATLRSHLDASLTAMANNQAAALGNLHVRLADTVHNASNNVLYEAQILRRMNCGSCRKDFAGRKRFNADGFFICPECVVAQGLD